MASRGVNWFLVGLALWVGQASAQVGVWPSPRAVTPAEDGTWTYRVVVVNHGADTAHDVVVVERLAQGVELAQAVPPGLVEGDTVTFALGELAPGQSRAVELRTDGPSAGATVLATVAGRRGPVAGPETFEAPVGFESTLAPSVEANAADPEVLGWVYRHGGDVDRLAQAARAVRFEAYPGTLRGARGALWSGAGNALDQASLLVAGLRAAGVPARYVRGPLDDPSALLASLTAAPRGLVSPGLGLDPPEQVRLWADVDWREDNWTPLIADAVVRPGDTPATLLGRHFPDPLADPAFASATDHAAVEYWDGDDWQRLDPTGAGDFAGAPLEALPEADRHTVRVQVVAERMHPLFDLLRGPRETIVADLQVASVEITGEPIELTFESDTVEHPGLVFGAVQHRYTPVLRVGDRTVRGQAFEETLSNFPGGSIFVAGVAVDLTVSVPGSEDESSRHWVFDRLGPSYRSGGPLEVELELDAEPALGGGAFLHIWADGADLPTYRAQRVAKQMWRRTAGLAHRMDQEVARLRALPPAALVSPEDVAFLLGVVAERDALARLQSIALGTDYRLRRQSSASALSQAATLSAYPARPQVFVTGQLTGLPAEDEDEAAVTVVMDIVDDGLLVVRDARTPAFITRDFHGQRQFLAKIAEEAAFGAVYEAEAGTSFVDFWLAAEGADAQVRVVEDLAEARRLSIPEALRSQLVAALRAESAPVVAERALAEGGALTYGAVATLLDGEPQFAVFLGNRFLRGKEYNSSLSLTRRSLLSPGAAPIIASLTLIDLLLILAVVVKDDVDPAVALRALTTFYRSLQGVAAERGFLANTPMLVAGPSTLFVQFADQEPSYVATWPTALARTTPLQTGGPATLEVAVDGPPAVLDEVELRWAFGALEGDLGAVSGGAFGYGGGPATCAVFSGALGGAAAGRVVLVDDAYAVDFYAAPVALDACLDESGVPVDRDAAIVDGPAMLRGADLRVTGADGIVAAEGSAWSALAQPVDLADPEPGLAAAGFQLTLGVADAVVARGETAAVPIALGATIAGPVVLTAESDALEVTLTPDAAQVRARPGVPDGAYPLRVRARWGAEMQIEAARTVLVRVEDAAEPLTVQVEDGAGWALMTAEGLDPLSRQVTVTNGAAAPQTVALEARPPAGYSAVLGSSTMRLAGGESETTVVTVVPEQPTPAGTPVALQIAARGDLGQVEIPADLEVPAIYRAACTFTPGRAVVAAGETTVAELSVQVDGDPGAPLLVQLYNESAALAAEGLPERVAVDADTPFVSEVAVTVQPDAVPGLEYGVYVAVLRPDGGAVLCRPAFKVRAVGPAAGAFAEAAGAIGDPALTDALVSLAAAVDAVAFGCDPDTLAALRDALEALDGALRDPIFADIRAQIADLLDTLAEGCAGIDLAALQAFAEEVLSLAEARAAYDFAVTLTPQSAVRRPGEPAFFDFDVEPIGAGDTDYRVQSAEAMIDQVGLRGISPVEFCYPAPGRYPFTITVSAEEDPRVTRSVRGLVIVTDVFAEVEVGVTPAFVQPGANIEPTAILRNLVNLPLEGVLRFELLDPEGQVAEEVLEPITLASAAGAQAFPVRLEGQPPLRMTIPQDAVGEWSVRVTLLDMEGQPVPGVVGEAPFGIGLPFYAVMVTDPEDPVPDEPIEVRLELTERARPGIPGLQRATRVDRFPSTAEGPAGLAIDGDDQVYAVNFGRGRFRVGDEVEAGRTVTRVAAGQSEAFAQVGNGPVGAAIDDAGEYLYVTHVGGNEGIDRIHLQTGQVNRFLDADDHPGIPFNNVTDLVFGEDGVLYAPELFTGAILDNPGRAIYRIEPDRDADGRSDGVSRFYSDEQRDLLRLTNPYRVEFDRRTGDLLVAQLGPPRRVVNINTVGELDPFVLFEEPSSDGLLIGRDGILYSAVDQSDEVRAYQTTIADGRTRLVGDGERVIGGLRGASDMEQDSLGNLWTTMPEDDDIVRIRMEAPRPEAEASVAITMPGQADADQDSAAPLAIWQGDTAEWAGEPAASYSVTHRPSGRAGESVQLTGETTVVWTEGDVDYPATLPPVRRMFQRLLYLDPDTVVQRSGIGRFVTIHLNNPGPRQVGTLTVERFAPGVVARLKRGAMPLREGPLSYEIPAGRSQAELQLQLPAALEGEDHTFTVRLILGDLEDEVVGRFRVEGEGVRLGVTPGVVQVANGDSLTLSYTVEYAPDDPCDDAELRFTGFPELGGSNLPVLNVDSGEANDPDQFVRERTIDAVDAPAGRYRLEAVLASRPFCAFLAPAVTHVEVVDRQAVALSFPEAPVVAFVEEAFSTPAVLENLTQEARTVRITHEPRGPLTDHAYTDLDGNELGEMRLEPGERRRVLVHGEVDTLGGQEGPVPLRAFYRLVDSLGARFNRESVPLEITAFGRLGNPLLDEDSMRLEPEVVDAEAGVAEFEAVVTVRRNHQQTWQVSVDPPFDQLATVDPAEVEIDAGIGGGAARIAIRLEGLDELGGGAWPVTVRGVVVGREASPITQVATVNVPGSGLLAAFVPETVRVAADTAGALSLVLRNRDVAAPLELDLVVAGDLDQAVALPERLLPAQSVALPVTFAGHPPGTYAVRAERAGAILAEATVEVLGPDSGPLIEQVEIVGEPVEATEVEVRLVVRDEDDPPEALMVGFDADGDGIYDEFAARYLWPLSLGNGPEHPIGFMVMDAAGAMDQHIERVAIINLPPMFVEPPSPPLEGEEAVLYRFAPQATDPGGDALTFRLTDGPVGAEVIDDEVVWTPDFGAAGDHDFALEVCDTEDACAAPLRWTVTVAAVECPRACLDEFGLEDCAGDADGDGVSNGRECLGDTRPDVSDRPPEPELVAPLDRARVLEALTLEVLAEGVDIELVVLQGWEEEGAQVARRAPTAELVWSPEDLPPDRYSWQARSWRAGFASQWTERAEFQLGNTPPPAPTLVQPEPGAVGEGTPTFIVELGEDLDGDPQLVEFEVRDVGAGPVADRAPEAELQWMPEAVLADGAYEWRARATDGFEVGAWSDWSGFTVVESEPKEPGPEPLEGEPLGGEPVGAEPLEGEPLEGEPVGAEPVGVEPVGAEPVGAEPVGAEPVGAEPIGAEPDFGAPAEDCDCDAAGPRPTAPVLLLVLLLWRRRQR